MQHMLEPTMRIAHFSDLHLFSLEGATPRRFLNKRLTGYANIRLKRGHIHRSSYVRAIAREIARLRIDHVVVTGDLTNLALEAEFALAREVIEEDLSLDPRHVTLVPGNHDLYTRGAQRSGRFTKYFAKYLTSDLPDLAVDVGVGRFPVVKLRGPAAVIGLSSAVPRLPFVAAGEIGRAQLEAFGRVLEHPEVASRTPVVALHHPAHNPRSWLKSKLEGLYDAEHLQRQLAHLRHGLVLHGHLHRRMERPLPTASGVLQAVGATSASLHPSTRSPTPEPSRASRRRSSILEQTASASSRCRSTPRKTRPTVRAGSPRRARRPI
jgi:3',5'-cyclic AMP phosphodiesterase CpdA